jgi:iron complex outermembrane receptor protein
MKANRILMPCTALVAFALINTPALFAQAAPTSTTTATTTTTGATTTTTSTTTDQPSTDQTVTLGAYVVSGLRGSLASAEEIKENSQGIVDSIVASDIDKLPDINVSYALARIPDVQLAHTFSGLGGNGAVTIDGLNQIVSTLDGHEVMTPGGIANGTAGVGVGQRTFDYSQIPSALVAGIDVYRTSAANQIDGGLSGVVDVRMRKPFDFPDGFSGGGTFGTTYSVLKNGENQNYNFFINDTAKTDFGKIGVLVSFSDITTPWREDSVGIGNPTPDPTVTTGVGTALTTTGYTDSASYGEFETQGFDAVLQWQPNPGLELHVEYNPNRWKNIQDESEFAAATPVSAVVAGSGTMFAGSTTATQSATFNNVTGTAYGLIRDLQNQLDMFDAGGKFTSGDLTINFDGDHYTGSNRFHNNLVFASVAIPSVSYNLGGPIPSVTYAGVNLEDPTQYHLSQVDYRLYPSNVDGKAGKIEGTYDFGKSFITKLLAGVRYSQTTSDNLPTGLFLGSYNIPASNNLLSQHPGLWIQNPIQNLFSGYDQTQFQQYLVQNTAFMRNANELYQDYNATNTPDTSATINPLSLFSIKETTTAVYLMPEFAGTVAGLPFDGNFGYRFVHTQEDASGYQGASAATAVPLDLVSSYNDWLPSFNFRLKITPTLFFRVAAANTITRPSFSQLSPSLVLNANPVNPSLNSGSQGNPGLQPVRSTNYNAALEYYPSKSSVFYGGVFQKDVKGFIGSFSQPETYSGVTYEIQTYSNLNPATIKGYDVGFQQFFTMLPAPFDGLGIQANYTYVDSTTPTTVSGVGLPVNAPLQNLSKQSYNLILMYEKGPFSARVGYNYRTSFVTGFAYYVNTGLLDQELAGYGDLDASLNYSISKNIELAIQGVNLSNTLRYQYFGSKMFPSNIYLDGPQLMTSVTLRF